MATSDASPPVEQALYFPEPMLDEIRRQAIRTDRSLSNVVQCAWHLARAQIRELADWGQAQALQLAYPEATKRKQTLVLPREMAAELAAEAEDQISLHPRGHGLRGVVRTRARTGRRRAPLVRACRLYGPVRRAAKGRGVLSSEQIPGWPFDQDLSSLWRSRRSILVRYPHGRTGRPASASSTL